MGKTEAELTYTPIDQIEGVVTKLRNTFFDGRTLSLDYRRKQLTQLLNLIKENDAAIHDAAFKDLAKCKFETEMYEIRGTAHEIISLIEELEEFTKHEIVSNDIVNAMDKTMIRRDPKGLILVIGAWNYPIYLTLNPLAGAIASGCTAVLKPSEVSSHTAKLLGELIPKYLDQEAYAVVNGAVEETTELLKHQWDHILYTGNGTIGKVIMTAAAKHLTPVTLELGGKCPVIVSDDSDMDLVAGRLLSGRLANMGQTCICIDYILCSEKVRDQLIPLMKTKLAQWYGEDIQKSPDLGRIVNIRHWNRIMGYLKATKGKAVIGGESQADEKDLYIPPTVVIDCDDDEPLMVEEIFGPIMPIRTVKNLDEAIKFVNARPQPLALYVFSRNSEEVDRVLARTRSGGVTVNDSIFHVVATGLPFGGCGPSGMGAYHGKFSFDTFMHQRATLIKSQSMEIVNEKLRYPPYSEKKTNILSYLMFKSSPSSLPKLPWKLIVGVVVAAYALGTGKPQELLSGFF